MAWRYRDHCCKRSSTDLEEVDIDGLIGASNNESTVSKLSPELDSYS